jgi:hypothetical protein
MPMRLLGYIMAGNITDSLDDLGFFSIMFLSTKTSRNKTCPAYK